MTFRPLHLALPVIALMISSCAYVNVHAPASPSAGTVVNWPGVKFSEVRAYCYDYTAEESPSFLVNGRMHKGVMDPKGVRLNPAQVQRLMRAITVSHERAARSLCYRPHHAFVFYDASGKVVAVFEMCFGCNQFKETPDGLPEYIDREALYQLTGELGLPLGPDNAFYTQACRHP